MSSPAILANAKKYPLVIIFAVLSLLLLGVHVLRSGQIADKERVSEELSSELNVMTANLNASQALGDDVLKIENYLHNVESCLINREEKGPNIDFFYRFEDQTNIILKSVIPAEDVKKIGKIKTFDCVGFGISLDGNFYEVMKFLYTMSHSGRLMRIESIDLSQNLQVDPDNGVSCKVNLQLLGKK